MEQHSEDVKKIQESLNGLLQRQEQIAQDLDVLREAIRSLNEQTLKESSTKEEIKEQEPSLTPPVVEVGESPVSESNRFYRSKSQKILGGVASGLANYLKVSPILIRIFWVVLTVLFCIGPLIYILLWEIVPQTPIHTASTLSKTTPQPPNLSRKDPAELRPREPLASLESGPQTTENLEKYIGQNLISKIGIAILVIGVGLGVKYSIDNDLISPVFRILLAYLVGGALVVVSLRLKGKHKNFSAVLLSGAIVIMYFTTYASRIFYEILPLWATFVLMLVFTVAAVVAAMAYNLQIIAHLGMVGAYALPFLIQNETGNPALLFGYMTIINIGILTISFYKYWKPLSQVSFGLTWLIYLTWYALEFESHGQLNLAWTALAVFYVLFYLSFLAYKLKVKQLYESQDIALILFNIFIFFGVGIHLLLQTSEGSRFLGLFALCNALPPALLTLAFYKVKGTDKNVALLFAGLALLFISISVPIQLDGNWVTLLWIGEATVLFHIGTNRKVAFYKRMAYGLLCISFISLLQDWTPGIAHALDFSQAKYSRAFWNVGFLTALIFAGCVGYLNLVNWKAQSKRRLQEGNPQDKTGKRVLFGLFLFVMFATISLEIDKFWLQTGLTLSNAKYFQEIRGFRTLSLLNFGFVFLTALAWLNYIKIKTASLGRSIFVLILGVLFLFLTGGLSQLSNLKESYLTQDLSDPSPFSPAQVAIRYISFLFLAALITVGIRLYKSNFMRPHLMNVDAVKDLVLAITLGWILTSEMNYWLNWNSVANAFKLWISLLWGAYALSLIVFGIWKKNKPIRILAIVLFFVTLLKLFAYDITHLDTISKTLVFFVLGMLLLVISYLYNRFKNII